jgi:hypothetical protein
MDNSGAPTVHHDKVDRFRMLRVLVAGLVILAVVLFMVAQVVNADAPTTSISALRSIVPTEEPPTPVPPTVVPPTGIPPTTRPRVTPKPVLPKTGGEVEAPVQDNSGLATAGIVGLGALLVVGAVVLSRANSNRKSDNA